MNKFLIFAGTTEGRELVDYLSTKEVKLHVCVATEYGETLMKSSRNITVSSERLTSLEIEELIKKKDFDLVIDTTHPYAKEVTKNIKLACKNTKCSYIRLLRDEQKNYSSKNCIYVDNVDKAVEYLKGTVGNVLVTTGSKELMKFTEVEGYQDRIFARVLSTYDVVKTCDELGFRGKNLIAMQGPFSEELNIALLKQVSANFMVTKESGKAGGFLEKISACEKLDVVPIVIGRMEEDDGFSYSELIKILEEKYKIIPKRKVSLVGIGVGNYESLTIEAVNVFKEADVIIGAKRMLETVSMFNKKIFSAYKYDEILEFIDKHEEYEKIAIAYSGDVGFYSGAKKLSKMLKNYEINIIPGISSIVYFMSRLKESWDDVKLISLHGKDYNIIEEVKYNKKVFALLGSNTNVSSISRLLIENNLNNVILYVGENLSYNNEKIHVGIPEEFINFKNESLSVILIENKEYQSKKIYEVIKDDEYIRGEVPITKEDIRTLSIVKLGLNNKSIVYDVGAGTGGISIEIAKNIPYGKVYSIEKNSKGVELIKANKEKFNISNIKIIEGVAPEIFKDLEAPTHAFIGGSSGNLKSIISSLLSKNPFIKMVITSITLETIIETMECIKEFNLADIEISQVNIAKSKKVGRYNMMMGENPIYIISFKGGLLVNE